MAKKITKKSIEKSVTPIKALAYVEKESVIVNEKLSPKDRDREAVAKGLLPKDIFEDRYGEHI